jgi:formate hydrogenlyase transcriptional activator
MDHSTGIVGSQASACRLPAERARVLLEINNAIVSHFDLALVLKGVSDCLRREIKHDFAGLALYDADRHELRLHALDFPDHQDFLEKGQLIPLVGTPASLAFASRKPVLRHRPDFDEFPADIMKRAYAQGIRSGCAVPLLCRDKIVGSMVLASLRESAFTEDDAQLLTHIGTQVAIAVDNALNYERLRRAESEATRERDRSRLLLEVNNAVVSHLDLSELLNCISGRLGGVMSNDSAFIALCDAEGTQLQVQALDVGRLENVKFAKGLLIPMAGTPEEQAIVSRQPVLVKSVAEFMNFSSPWVHYAVEHGVKSGCFFPLMAHGHTLGALGVVSIREEAFNAEDATLLEQISIQIAIAVENALNFEKSRQAEREVRHERDRSELLLDINNALVSHLDLDALVKAISFSLRQVIDHDSFSLALYKPESGLMFARALESASNPVVEEFEYDATDTVSGLAFASGEPAYLPRPDSARFPSPVSQKFFERGMRTLYSVPVTTHGRKLGVLTFASSREAAWTEDEREVLQEITKQVAIAVENSLNFEKARQAEREVRQERDRSQLLLEINNALVSHLDLRDLVQAISRSLQQVLQHDCVALGIYDAESGKMFAQAVSSVLHPMQNGIYYAPEGTVSGLTFKTGRPVYVPRLDFESFPSPATQAFRDCGLKSLYAVPVTVHGRVLGVMSISSMREDAFTGADQELFQQVAKQVAIATANALAVRNLEALKEKLAQEKLYLEDEIRSEFNFEEIIGQSAALRQVLKLVDTVASSDSTVLLLGETGTGKELIARAVHDHSRRKSRTFVKLNCAAIPTGLLESELFGHEKGAFTGAIAQKIGRLELADQGTLFLDEVGDIPPEIQPKLLRALQEREFERLGSTYTKKVNVRLVAATNRDLEKMTETREFRSDLCYRLNVFPIRIPPLRERPEDIPLLVRYFAEKFARQMQKRIESIPADTMGKLQRWHWPGNVRELENLIERAVILTTGSALQVPMPEIKSPAVGTVRPAPATNPDGPERELIIKVLRETRGVLAGPNGAASRLGLKRTTLSIQDKEAGHHVQPVVADLNLGMARRRVLLPSGCPTP